MLHTFLNVCGTLSFRLIPTDESIRRVTCGNIVSKMMTCDFFGEKDIRQCSNEEKMFF